MSLPALKPMKTFGIGKRLIYCMLLVIPADMFKICLKNIKSSFKNLK